MPSPYAEQQDGVDDEMAQRPPIRRGRRPGAKSDAAGPMVSDAEQERAPQGKHREAGLNQLEERQDEQIEADVAPVDGVRHPEILRPDQAQEPIPVAIERETEDRGGPRRCE